MSSYTNPYVVSTVSDSPEAVRAEFIRKTYGHLAGAIALFITLEWFFISLGWGKHALTVLETSRYSWLIVLGGFIPKSEVR